MRLPIELLFVFLLIARISFSTQQYVGYPNTIQVEKMTMKWKRVGNKLHCSLTAPTTGWLAIGFNQRNAILHADLKMFRVKNGVVEAQDMYVSDFRDPKNDESLGGDYSISQLSGNESSKSTTINFTLDLSSKHYSDQNLNFSKAIWCIAAYSTSDDFDHHSIMRQHQLVKFEE